MASEKYFIAYICTLQKELEGTLRSIGALDSCSNQKLTGVPVSSTFEAYRQLGIIYWYWGYYRRGARMFGYCLELDRPQINASDSPVEACKNRIEKCVLLKLAGIKDNRPEACAAEILKISASAGEWRAACLKNGYYNEVGFLDLWKGYALLLLRRHEEAIASLESTVSLYERYRKRHGIWQKEEAFLPKALLPVARYGWLPDEQSKKEAWKGMEEFIALMRDDLRHPDDTRKDLEKLAGYFYYFHLKEAFPQIFSGASGHP